MMDTEENKASTPAAASATAEGTVAGNEKAPCGKASEKGGDTKGRPKTKKSDLGVRCVVGFIYFVVSTVCVLAGDIPAVAYLAFVAGSCSFEFYRMMRLDDKLVNEWAGIAAAASFPIVVYFFGAFGIMVASAVFMIALIVWYVFWPKARTIDMGLSYFGALYMGMPLSCLVIIRMDVADPWGGVVLLALLMSVWFNDVGAYLVGRKFGKHKMAPLISPKKTWEGFIGGLVGSIIVWLGISYIPCLNVSLYQAVLFGAICGAMGVVGDLVESRIKRNVGVKDSGTLMPGHGGMFDRNDSLFAVSVTAIVLLYLGGCIPNVAL